VKLIRYADRPDLLERRFEELVRPTFPEYMIHNEPGRNWGRLYADFPERGRSVQRVFDEARQLRDGRWLFVRV
jgi:hypothetical protein